MALSVRAFLGLLAAVALLRGVELMISRRHQGVMALHGARLAHDPDFRWMVGLHAGVLVGAAVEVVLLKRPFMPLLAIPAALLFAAANLVRWWVIRTLGNHWNVRVIDSIGMGVITAGPFRWVRHPNYAAVFLELAALPLIHTAWLTASIGSAVHVWVMARRLAVEERVLHRDGNYRALMGHKPRFLPRLGRSAVRRAAESASMRSD